MIGNMKIAMLTEMPFTGKIPATHRNMRTEFAWMYALNANHYNIHSSEQVSDYDAVFIIFPKGKLFLSAEGSVLVDGKNPVSDILRTDFVSILKSKNRKVYYIQEGPHWWFNDYSVEDQINFYNMINSCDGIFCHNETDLQYYKGLFCDSAVSVIPTLMIDSLIENMTLNTQEKTIIGGNFSRWYGGFESYIVASNFDTPIFAQTSHSKRPDEEHIHNLTHLPRLEWVEWMKELSTFRYAVHLMPTVAAGTFSLNCAYFGIPCIGNDKVDTQLKCHPLLSIDVSDIEGAVNLARKLKTDIVFYNECSEIAKENYKNNFHINIWKEKMNNIFINLNLNKQ